jgi:AcrR family transcriptional regulator
MREGGLGAVAVEPLAERLGTTKGSFYWHFKDRDSLIQAALERWVAESEEMLAAAERIEDPAERGRRLTEFAFSAPSGADITTTLLVHAHHPVVGPILEQVTRRRLEFGARLSEQLGLSADEAYRHALTALTMTVGIALMRRGAPQLLPQGEEKDAYVRYIVDLLAPPLV